MRTSASPGSRRRLLLVVAVALTVVVAAGGWLTTGQSDPPSQTDAAAASDAAACGPVLREPTNGAHDHVDDAAYDDAPPSFGDHASSWEVRANSFYDVDDRPDVSVLVHNLEHGYNVLWYDQTVLDDADAPARVQEIADAYASLDRAPDPATAFIAVPWTAEDGADFPEGVHYALTHWYADPEDRTRSRADEEGLTRYCPGISAEIVEDWMTEYPLHAAPEGLPDLM
ncbi:MAG: DUF3105 domain-containing protein [Nocardioides sp.]